MKSNLLLCPVDDLEAAVAFYRDALGLPLKFRDGDRYCAFDAGGYTLGLAARDERVAEVAAPAFRVEDLGSALHALLGAGASLLRPVEAGPHESRAVLGVPGGGALVLSAKLV
jgi:predicted enzyme related to lactoylglutathione lyase